MEAPRLLQFISLQFSLQFSWLSLLSILQRSNSSRRSRYFSREIRPPPGAIFKQKLVQLVVADIAAGIKGDARINLHQIKDLIHSIATAFPAHRYPVWRTYCNLKRKLKESDTLVLKGDKGECQVLMSRSEYDQKVLDFFAANEAKKVKFSISGFNAKVHAAIKSASLVIPGSPTKKRLKKSHVAVPTFYGQVKIHKEGLPLRHVVAFYNEPTVDLCRYLVNFFYAFIPDPPPLTVKNSLDFAHRLSEHSFSSNALCFIRWHSHVH